MNVFETMTLEDLAAVALGYVRIIADDACLARIRVLGVPSGIRESARDLDAVLTARLKQAFEDEQLDEPLTITRAAEVYGVSRQALYQAAREGRVEVSRASGAPLVTRRAIDGAIRDGRFRGKRNKPRDPCEGCGNAGSESLFGNDPATGLALCAACDGYKEVGDD